MSTANEVFQELWGKHPINVKGEKIAELMPDWHKTDAKFYFMMGVTAALAIAEDERLDAKTVQMLIQNHLKFTGYSEKTSN
jgi:hypothetical protein